MPPPAPSATLTGVLERIIFLNEENHYTIAEFRPDTPVGRELARAPAAATTPGSSCFAVSTNKAPSSTATR